MNKYHMFFDDPKREIFEFRCKDTTMYCLTTVAKGECGLVEDIIEEFGEDHNYIDIADFDSLTVDYAICQYVYPEDKPSIQQISTYIACAKYLQVSAVKKFTIDLLNTLECRSEFFYFYYMHKYHNVDYSYPKEIGDLHKEIGSKYVVDCFINKISELLEDYSEICKLFETTRHVIFSDLESGKFKDLTSFFKYGENTRFSKLIIQWIKAHYPLYDYKNLIEDDNYMYDELYVLLKNKFECDNWYIHAFRDWMSAYHSEWIK